jgi:hypothetical protein
LCYGDRDGAARSTARTSAATATAPARRARLAQYRRTSGRPSSGAAERTSASRKQLGTSREAQHLCGLQRTTPSTARRCARAPMTRDPTMYTNIHSILCNNFHTPQRVRERHEPTENGGENFFSTMVEIGAI